MSVHLLIVLLSLVLPIMFENCWRSIATSSSIDFPLNVNSFLAMFFHQIFSISIFIKNSVNSSSFSPSSLMQSPQPFFQEAHSLMCSLIFPDGAVLRQMDVSLGSWQLPLQ